MTAGTMNAPKAKKNAKNEAAAPLAPLAPQTVEEILANPTGEGVDLLVRDGQTGELKIVENVIPAPTEEPTEEGKNVLTVDGQPVDKAAEAVKAANATKEALRKKQEAADEQARNAAIAKTIIKQASNACKAKLSDKKGAAEALQVEGMRFAGAQAKMVGMKPRDLMEQAMEWMNETQDDDDATGFTNFFFA